MSGFWDPPTGDSTPITAEAVSRLFDDIKAGKMDDPCRKTGEHVLMDWGPTPDLCQCAGCMAFFPRPSGPRKPGARQWEDRR